MLWLTASQAVSVGVVRDGPIERESIPLGAIVAEVQDLVGDEFRVEFPPEFQVDGGWTEAGVRAALNRLMAEPRVAQVLTLGLVASHVAASMPELGKPVIAPVTADAALQHFPLVDGASGKSNFTYISNFHSVANEIEAFHRAVGFRRLAVVADRLPLTVIPNIGVEKRAELEAQLGIAISVVGAAASADEVLAALGPDVEAVYLTPLVRFSIGEFERLLAGLAARRLPSFSMLGGDELEAGALMSTGGREGDITRLVRRIALNVQRVLLGEDPAGFQVAFPQTQRLQLNMRTAAAIGFSPRWDVLSEAELKHGDEQRGQWFTLTEVLERAMAVNSDLETARLGPVVAADASRRARAALLPRLSVGVSATEIDADRANPAISAERSSQLEIGGVQSIYSDDAWAGYRISQHQQDAAVEVYRAVLLDTQRAAASGYLQLLRARALEAVQRSNLEVTRTNFDLARLREQIGATDRADRLRWQSRLATDKQNLIAAQANTRAATTELNRVLNRPQNDPIATPEASLDAALEIFFDPRFERFVANPEVWLVFQDFVVDQALDHSPDLAQLDALIAAQERDLLAARRKLYVPEITLQGSLVENLDRSGAGSDLTGTGLDDRSETLSVAAELPLFAGGALRARRSQAANQLEQLNLQYAAVAEAVEAQTRFALHRTGSSYAAVSLSAEAAEAATENLELVAAAYASGAASITELIDAQRAALLAQLDAAESRYAYLLDLVDVLRASADFSLLLDPGRGERWQREIEDYFDRRGVEPLDQRFLPSGRQGAQQQ